MIYTLLLALLLPTCTLAVNCYRCFGYGFCQDPQHEEFASKVATVTCGSSKSSPWDGVGSVDDPFSLDVQKALDNHYKKNFQRNSSSSRATETQYHCITVRTDEPYNNNYTYRTCVSLTLDTDYENPTLCELIDAIVEPQNKYGGSLSCRTCNNADLCNNHVLSSGDGLGGGDSDGGNDDDGGNNDDGDNNGDGGDSDDGGNEVNPDRPDSAVTHLGQILVIIAFSSLLLLTMY